MKLIDGAISGNIEETFIWTADVPILSYVRIYWNEYLYKSMVISLINEKVPQPNTMQKWHGNKSQTN